MLTQISKRDKIKSRTFMETSFALHYLYRPSVTDMIHSENSGGPNTSGFPLYLPQVTK